jgi:hypothetical protein
LEAQDDKITRTRPDWLWRQSPNPCWPNGARLALNFVLNYEEGSEYSIGDGDGVTDSGLVELSNSPVPRVDRDLAAESMYEFGSRVGFWRRANYHDLHRCLLIAFSPDDTGLGEFWS